MMATYSPPCEQPESPHRLRSHASVAHFDCRSAISEIRRSLSRSPSKGSEFRTYPIRSPAVAATSFSPSPLSPSRKFNSENTLHVSSFMSPHPSRITHSSRLGRPANRRSLQPYGLSHRRTSPKSPTKRVLTDSGDSGNSSPMPQKKRGSTESDREMAGKHDNVCDDKENETMQDDIPAKRPPMTRQEKRRSAGALIMSVAPMSPMKRPERSEDHSMKDSGMESPSAKRRSLNGPSLDFSIFESDNLDAGFFTDKRAQDDTDWFASQSASSPSASSKWGTVPKRAHSLRKSTLQQRQTEQRSLNHKFTPAMDVDRPWNEATAPTNTKSPFRQSLGVEPLPRESPFSSQGSLLDSSIHPIVSSQHTFAHPPPRHPLSRTVTQSSSTLGDQDDSPTHEPIHRPPRPRSYDFSISLPLTASRPLHANDGTGSSSQGSFATPGNYKTAKPLPAAFMSTGLISKKNRNAEEPNAGLPKAHMPDTPCKRQSVMFGEDKFQNINPSLNRASRQSIGGASGLDTPNPNAKVSIFPFSKSLGIFGSRPSKQKLLREGSFASIESYEKPSSQSPSHGGGESQSTDSDYPPTPTKNFPDALNRKTSVSPSPKHAVGLSRTQCHPNSASGTRLPSSKFSPLATSPDGVDGDSDSPMEDSPSASLRAMSMPSAVSMPGSSSTHNRVSMNLSLPSPLSKKAIMLPALQPLAIERAKMISLSPASPHGDRFDHATPRTPLESYFPPDPSGLSISGHGRNNRFPLRHSVGNTQVIPATPTGPRESFPNFSNRPSLNLAAADSSSAETSLARRFDKVDLIGSGEFSQVYRVSQPPHSSPYHKIYSVSTSRPASRNSLPDKVWAVKRSRYPYSGTKDRSRKLLEVDALKALKASGHCDHILNYVDSWEESGHLYIQTEFGEEGTLDVFLAQVGLKARLDDFRIWKILLELSIGVKHIHDCGYIHLDLKPANILITFEGVLKIADFGMATKWPAKAGIEGEGDREYIGPEILMGKYDKPADIFALGLIMLEIAGNVELPDNGLSWQKLRNGDMSDVPSLTWSSGTSDILRDSSGNPIPTSWSNEHDPRFDEPEVEILGEAGRRMHTDHQNKNAHRPRSGELAEPPQFMVDPNHEQALDRVVRWMISPNPVDRPVADQILNSEGVRFADTRRRAGATVFEGNWGPADEILAEDAEMIDV